MHKKEKDFKDFFFFIIDDFNIHVFRYGWVILNYIPPNILSNSALM